MESRFRDEEHLLMSGVEAKVKERDAPALSNAAVTLISSDAVKAKL